MGISILHAGNAPQALTGNSGGLPGSSNLLIGGLDFSALLGGQLAGQMGVPALSGAAVPATALQDIAQQLSEKNLSGPVDRDETRTTTDLLQSMLDANPELASLLSGNTLSHPSPIAASANNGTDSAALNATTDGTLPNPAWLIPALPATPTPLTPAATGEKAARSDFGVAQQNLLSSELRPENLVPQATGKHFPSATAVDRDENAPMPSFALTAFAGGKDDAAAKIAANDASTPAQLPGNLAAQSTHLPRNITASHTIPASLHSTEWTQDFGNRVVWLARNDQQSAQININPANLGPIQINLSLQGDQMSANFVSAHGEVRQAIEDALPRLREMLSNSGIALGDANVGAQLPQQQRDLSSQLAKPSRLADENAILGREGVSATLTTSLPIQRGQGLVDLFA